MYSSSLTCILNNTVSRTAGAIILLISHGYEVKETNDPFVELANQATEQFSIATAPGGFLVDLIPASVCPLFFDVELTHSRLVRHLPEWFPGAGFKKKAKLWSSTLHELVEQPHNYVKEQLVNNIESISQSISDLNPSCLLGCRNGSDIFLLHFT